MNQDKTKLVSFSKEQKRRGQPQKTFDFLGFTFYITRSRQGKLIAKIKTIRNEFNSKLKQVTKWARDICRKQKLKHIWPVFISKLRGLYAYAHS